MIFIVNFMLIFRGGDFYCKILSVNAFAYRVKGCCDED